MSAGRMTKQAGKIGIIGIILLAVLGYAGYVASDFISAQWQWYKIRRETLDIARFSRGVPEATIKLQVAEGAKKLGIPNISPIEFSREAHTDAKTQIRYTYSRDIDLKQFGTKNQTFKVDIFQGMPMVQGQM